VQDQVSSRHRGLTALLSAAGLFAAFIAATLLVPAQTTNVLRPEDVYSRFQAAWRTSDGVTVLACATPALQRELIHETAFHFSMRNTAGLEPFLDEKKAEEWIEANSPPTSNFEYREYLFAVVKDPAAFLSVALKRRSSSGDADQPLRNLILQGDRARGVVTRYITGLERQGGKDVATSEPYDRPVHFRRIEGRWYLDVADAAAKGNPSVR
jgi:hypothetical protein